MIYIMTVTIETNCQGCNHEETVEVDVPDDATPEQVEAALEEEARVIFFNQCSYGYISKKKK